MTNMLKTFQAGLVGLAIFLGGASLPGIARAAVIFIQFDAIFVDPIAVNTCGDQQLTFSGRALYSQPTQHIIVELGGAGILHSDDEPATWTTGPVAAGVGTHVLRATMYDDIDHAKIIVVDTKEFVISPCSAPAVIEAGGGPIHNQDCCPGPDPVVPQPPAKKHARVKGAQSHPRLPASVIPLNSLFRTVHGRGPTRAEWDYWAGRLLNDKPAHDALLGAMQWHALRGHSVGEPEWASS